MIMANPLRFNAPTMTDMWHKGNERILFAKADDLGYQSGATTGVFDCMLMCDSMEFDFDCGLDLWLTKHRFKKLQRDYLDYELTQAFIEKSASMKPELAKRGTLTQLSARVHGSIAREDGRKENYKWGNCIFGWSFRPALTHKGILTMHSRTSYICYMGGMDLALSYHIAKKIAEARGDDVREYGFRWSADSLQWYSIKAMAYVHAYGLVPEFMDSKTYPDAEYPTAKITRNSYNFLHKRWDNEEPPKYGPTLRVWQQMFGIAREPVSCPVDELELEMYT